MFDFALGAQIIEKEIVKCIDLAKNGIHAMLFVFSINSRFTVEEEAAVRVIKGLFGHTITDYVIIVFTGGDMLDDDTDEGLKEYLDECPKPLQEILQQCNNRVALFDNKTNDPNKRELQVCKLISLVDKVIKDNGGQPYTNELFIKLQKEIASQHKQFEIASKGKTEKEISMMQEKMQKGYEEQLKQVTEMLEKKFEDTISQLQEELKQEKVALSKAIKQAQMDRQKSAGEVRNLVQELTELRKEKDQFLKKVEKMNKSDDECACVVS
ncbi:PREDICTED: immune-associated nucleotide-binding protein 8-like isoform X2 [Nelumbo nucifera]|nr:PREDICTED: immune-associated nucleotide-binding protein 8-like isoform X2 [Nelumbo nucifera]